MSVSPPLSRRIYLRTTVPLLGAAILAFSTASAGAQTDPAGPTTPPGERWRVHAPSIAAPPNIDGHLEAGEWAKAAVISDFGQVEPREGVEPSEETRVLIMVDRDFLYIALDSRDSDPAGILASQITRDAVLDPDDRVEIVLDTFHDRRNGYFFQIGPGGSKGDALIGNNGSFFSKDWDGIWHGKAVIHDGGWSAEIALPAKTLSFQPGLDQWGLNIRRHIKRKNEQAQWASPTRRNRLFQMAAAGTLTGMAMLDPGLELDVVPFVAVRNQRDDRSDESSLTLEPGLDLRYKITPSLTASLTVNTDFAETEVDSRVVNLTRFPVFFPEKRDFFLEDSGIFDFGGLDNDLVPFFSRRIGLGPDGEPVPIVAGGKVTGRVGRWNLGLLDVATDSQGELPSKNLAAARVAVNVLAESQVGFLATAGDPGSDGDNALAGVDFSYRTRGFRGDRNLQADLFALWTEDDPALEDRALDDRGPGGAPAMATVGGHAFGFRLGYPNDVLELSLGAREVSADFRPDLGFVRRRGTRQVFAEWQWEPRPASGPVRRFGFAFQPQVFLFLGDPRVADDTVETAEWRITPFEILFHSGDRVEVTVTPTEERLLAPFEIAPGVVIPPGTYRFDRFEVEAEFADTRRLFGEVEFETGTFFDGRRDSLEVQLAWRPIRRLTLDTTVEHNEVELLQGDFTTNLAQLRSTVDFTPEISWISFLQWDDVSDSLGVNSRLRWILSPGREIFLVWNRSFDTRVLDRRLEERRSTLAPRTTDTTVKIEYTLRF